MFFPVITKNSNGVQDRVKNEAKHEKLFMVFFLGGGFMKNHYRGGDCLKRGAWTVCRFKKGLARKRVWCF